MIGRNSTYSVKSDLNAFLSAAAMAGTSYQPIKKFDQIFLQGKHMNKSILIAAIASLGLAACGKEEPKVAPAPKVEVVVPAAPTPVIVAPAADAAKVDAAKDAAGKAVEAAKDAKDAAGKSVDAAGKAAEAAKDVAPKK